MPPRDTKCPGSQAPRRRRTPLPGPPDRGRRRSPGSGATLCLPPQADQTLGDQLEPGASLQGRPRTLGHQGRTPSAVSPATDVCARGCGRYCRLTTVLLNGLCCFGSDTYCFPSDIEWDMQSSDVFPCACRCKPLPRSAPPADGAFVIIGDPDPDTWPLPRVHLHQGHTWGRMFCGFGLMRDDVSPLAVSTGWLHCPRNHMLHRPTPPPPQW